METTNKIVAQDSMQSLMADLQNIINKARSSVAASVNYELTLMYWHIGERINRDILGNQRAEYGKQIVSAVATKLTWSHIIELLPLKDPMQREFYLTMASVEMWNTKRLRKEIDSLLYERTAIATKPDEIIKTELPPREILMQQLRKSLEAAKAERNEDNNPITVEV